MDKREQKPTGGGTVEPTVVIHMTPAALDRLIDARADARIRSNEIEQHQSYLSRLEPEIIELLIKGNRTEDELTPGDRFLMRVLREENNVSLEAFVNKALRDLDYESSITLKDNFTRNQRRLFAVREQGEKHDITRRHLMKALGAVCAVGLGTEGAVDAATKFMSIKDAQVPAETTPWRRNIQEAREVVHAGASLVLVGVGIHYGDDVIVEHARQKLENIEHKLKLVSKSLDQLAEYSRAMHHAGKTQAEDIDGIIDACAEPEMPLQEFEVTAEKPSWRNRLDTRLIKIGTVLSHQPRCRHS